MEAQKEKTKLRVPLKEERRTMQIIPRQITAIFYPNQWQIRNEGAGPDDGRCFIGRTIENQSALIAIILIMCR